ncbi:MAG TPA: hypothetical protein VJB87_01930 [Candidatus Nanoarchaeia archaeon]|nr:hypothetical protein [Candidatus Nanoarchaeia archaeon]
MKAQPLILGLITLIVAAALFFKTALPAGFEFLLDEGTRAIIFAIIGVLMILYAVKKPKYPVAMR